MAEMNLEEFLFQAEEWLGLGWAVQAQLKAVVNGEFRELNENAIEMIEKFGENLPFPLWQELEDKLDAYKDWKEENENSSDQ